MPVPAPRLTLRSIGLRVVSVPQLAAPFEVRNGMVMVPDKPSNGIEYDEQAFKRLLVS